jgi:hypothetical protein
MMSRYRDSHLAFALDLATAVIRQGSFVEKMRRDWLHSLTISSTTSRLLLKYERFFTIGEKNPNIIVVPILDVNLAWHTHQLSPRDYYSYYLIRRTKKFIDHDDKIDE